MTIFEELNYCSTPEERTSLIAEYIEKNKERFAEDKKLFDEHIAYIDKINAEQNPKKYTEEDMRIAYNAGAEQKEAFVINNMPFCLNNIEYVNNNTFEHFMEYCFKDKI